MRLFSKQQFFRVFQGSGGKAIFPSTERSIDLWPLQEASISTELSLTAEALVCKWMKTVTFLTSRWLFRHYLLPRERKWTKVINLKCADESVDLNGVTQMPKHLLLLSWHEIIYTTKKLVVFHPWTALLHQVRSRGFSQRLPDCRPKEASKGRERCSLYSGLSAIHIFSLFSPHSLVLFIFVLKCTIKQTLTAIWLRRSDCVLIHAEWEKKAHYINFNQTDIVDRNWCVFLY